MKFIFNDFVQADYRLLQSMHRHDRGNHLVYLPEKVIQSQTPYWMTKCENKTLKLIILFTAIIATLLLRVSTNSLVAPFYYGTHGAVCIRRLLKLNSSLTATKKIEMQVHDYRIIDNCFGRI